jgi:hypothetical protein
MSEEPQVLNPVVPFSIAQTFGSDPPPSIALDLYFEVAGLASEVLRWWLETELNRRHKDFQSSALPTELSSQP